MSIAMSMAVCSWPSSSWLWAPASGFMVMSWLIHIGITISVSQLVGAYMMSSMYMFICMELAFMLHACGTQPLSMISWSLALSVPCSVSPPALL
jgi:hypothetical protein